MLDNLLRYLSLSVGEFHINWRHTINWRRRRFAKCSYFVAPLGLLGLVRVCSGISGSYRVRPRVNFWPYVASRYMICKYACVGDERVDSSVDGDERFLQPREAGRVHQHRRHSDDRRHDPPGRRTQRHSAATQATVQHPQLHDPVERFNRQDLPHHQLRILHPGQLVDAIVY